MGRRLKSAKFSIRTLRESGDTKGMKLIGINTLYEGEINSITAKDFIDFLKKKKINPSDVLLGQAFMVKVDKK